jgi:hypothetical protein
MRAAPAVRVVVPPSGAWRWFGAAVPAAAVGSLCTWAVQRAQVDAPWIWASVASAVAGALAWRFARIDSGALAWDGAEWTFRDQPGDVQVMLDFDAWLLLRFDARGAPGSAWLALGERAAGPSAWHALRAAVYSRRPLTKPE